jgi:uncharacterized membrane protein
MKLNNKTKIITITLAAITLILTFLTQLTFLEALRITLGTPYVLFLPGYIISFFFFKKDKIEVIERIALSFALSIAIVPLAIFYLNLIGMKINLISSSLTIAAIIIISLLFQKGIITKKKIKKILKTINFNIKLRRLS